MVNARKRHSAQDLQRIVILFYVRCVHRVSLCQCRPCQALHMLSSRVLEDPRREIFIKQSVILLQDKTYMCTGHSTVYNISIRIEIENIPEF